MQKIFRNKKKATKQYQRALRNREHDETIYSWLIFTFYPLSMPQVLRTYASLVETFYKDKTDF